MNLMHEVTEHTEYYDTRADAEAAVITFCGDHADDYDIARIVDEAFVQVPTATGFRLACHLSPDRFGRLVEHHDRTAHHIETIEQRSGSGFKFFGRCSCGETSTIGDRAGYVSAWAAAHREEMGK